MHESDPFLVRAMSVVLFPLFIELRVFFASYIRLNERNFCYKLFTRMMRVQVKCVPRTTLVLR